MGIMDRMKGLRGEAASTGSQPYITNTPGGLPQITKKNAIIFAGAGGFVVALIALLIPVSILEMFTGASGLSEIIPAASAPLGFTARILFVAFLAILSSAIFLIIFMRFATDEQEDYMTSEEMNERARERSRMPAIDDSAKIANQTVRQDNAQYEELVSERREFRSNHPDSNYQNRANYQDRANYQHRERQNSSGKNYDTGNESKGGIVGIAAKMKSAFHKLPFMGGDDSVRSFDDLPKLRNADRHPDAPPRKPLSAHQDLGEKILTHNDYNQKDESDLDEILNSGSDKHLQGIEVQNTRSVSAALNMDNMESEVQELNAIEPLVEKVLETESNYHSDEYVDVNNAEDEIIDTYHAATNTHEQVAMGGPSKHHLTKTSADGDLPTLDDLMERLDQVVLRRKEKREDSNILQPQEQLDTFQPNASVTTGIDVEQPKIMVPKSDVLKAKIVETDIQTDEISKEELPARKIALVPKAEQNNGQPEGRPKETNAAQKQEMDAALKAALNTLHKMNERSV